MSFLLRRSLVRVNLFQSRGVAAEAAGEVAAAQAPKESFFRRSIKQFKDYVKLVFNDYKDVGRHTIKSANEKPFKALGYGLFLTSMFVFYKKNPEMRDYVNARQELFNDLLMCGSTYSKRSYFYLNELNRLDNLNQLEYKSFVFFSVILIKKFSEQDANYEKRCEQLNKPNKYNIFNVLNTSLRFVSRIVDIGFCDEWRYLNKNTKDYDVDELEWTSKTDAN